MKKFEDVEIVLLWISNFKFLTFPMFSLIRQLQGLKDIFLLSTCLGYLTSIFPPFCLCTFTFLFLPMPFFYVFDEKMPFVKGDFQPAKIEEGDDEEHF